MLRKTIDKILGNLLVFLMAVLVLDVLWQVFSRYVLINPSSYTDECAGYLLIWGGIVRGGLCQRAERTPGYRYPFA